MTQDVTTNGDVDPEVAIALGYVSPVTTLSATTLDAFRAANAIGPETVQTMCAQLGLTLDEHVIDGPGGPIEVTIVKPEDLIADAPIYVTVHGGGMVAGTRYSMLAVYDELQWAAEHRFVLVSPEYRLPPEHPAPAAAEDCYATLVWAASHSREWGASEDRMILAGISAGGGIAAATALMARDRGVVSLMAQMLICPMLDDRNVSTSALRYSGLNGGTWSRESNQWAWSATLGAGEIVDAESGYVVPARAADLAGLPSTFVDVGSAEVFRDECVDYAARLWETGVSAELHVWRGGFHGFDLLAPASAIGRSAREARSNWLRRVLSQP